jgi:hypothetical protein
MGFFKKRKEKKDFVDLGEMHNKRKVRNSEIRQELQNNSIQENSGEYTDLTSSQNNVSTNTISQESDTRTNSGMGFFGGFFGGNSSDSTPNTSQDNESYKDTVNPDEKKRRLSKKLKDLTEQIENLSNQIYRIEQRVEVLEKKNSSGY